ncbi:MAG: SpoIIE family protein phosphatase [Anaerolineae bacterium]|nr:SpoIIE family protein phosphatase [Anaerolineae bacterium]
MTRAYSYFLLITDQPEQYARVTLPFLDWGWDVTVIGGETGAALRKLAGQPYDLILLDVRTAERDDYAFLRARQSDPRLMDIPVVIIAFPRVALRRLARCIDLGAGDYITHPNNPTLMRARLQNVLQRKLLQEQAASALESFNEIEKIADDLRLVILPIGAALSAETEYDRLLARIVAEAQKICNAEAGALYLVGADGMLHIVYIRIDPLDYTYQGEARQQESTVSLPLYDPQTGEPNYRDLPVYVALTGESVNLSDINDTRFVLERPPDLDGEESYYPQTALAVPLVGGQVQGTLLLLNSRRPDSSVAAPPGGAIVPFDGYHQQVAESLASQAAVVLNNRLLLEQQAGYLRYKRELEIGRAIQRSFLPARLPAPSGWEVVARFEPAQEVAGDYYDTFLLPHGHLVAVIADVVGKGIPAAMFMAIIRSLFRGLFQQHYLQVGTAAGPGSDRSVAPSLFIDREALINAVRMTNAYLLTNHVEDYAFATLFAGVLDPGSGRLIYVNAGHNAPIVAGQGAIRARLEPTGPAIGLLETSSFELGEIHLRPGETLFTYTDGVIEARNPEAEEFGLERLDTLLVAHSDSAERALTAVEDALREFTAGAEAFDDVTMLALRRAD